MLGWSRQFFNDVKITRSFFFSKLQIELNVPHLKSCEIQSNRCAHAVLPLVASIHYCCGATRLCSRLISVEYVTSLGFLRQYQLYFRYLDVCISERIREKVAA